MARTPKPIEERPPPDALEGVPPPRQTGDLFGHAEPEAQLLDAYRSGRMHHAWLLSGPGGIGKATFAFRAARFILANPDPAALEIAETADLDVPADAPAARKVAAGVHPNLLHLQREFDEKNNRYRLELGVEVVRRLIPFLGSTAGEGAWRIVIVDTADEMTRSAANALLKALEEPPRQTIFFLVSGTPGRLPATIRSRSRLLRLRPLGATDMERVLAAAGVELPTGGEGAAILALAEGIPRRAIELVREDGLGLHRLICEAIGRADAASMHRLAEKADDARSGAFARFTQLLEGYLHRRVRGEAEPPGSAPPPALPLASWAALWEKAARSSREVEIYNLDRRAYVLGLLEACAAEGRRARSPATAS
jgi:DNA polymerase III subunit delta'